MNYYILALDQGTTSSRAILYSADAQPLLSYNKEFTQYYPQPGWGEHDAEELFECQLAVMKKTVQKPNKNSAYALRILPLQALRISAKRLCCGTKRLASACSKAPDAQFIRKIREGAS